LPVLAVNDFNSSTANSCPKRSTLSIQSSALLATRTPNGPDSRSTIAVCLANANGAVLPGLYAWDSMDLRMESSDAKEASTGGPVEAARRFYAEELRFHAHMASDALFAAFATVPRERFVGPGPWRILGEDGLWKTEDADPRQIYHNVLIALDEGKGINNGQPSLWALHLDRLGVRTGDHVLHLGCGTGYYTAILAEVVGPDGKIRAVDIDEGMAEWASMALAPWPQVTVEHGDGCAGPFEPVDVVVASAGATHPPAAWLAALKPGGRLLFPLTPDTGSGAMAHLTRTGAESFAARLMFGAHFIPFSGARDRDVSRHLAHALNRDQGAAVRSLRCDLHEKEETCWLHGEGRCFSTREPVVLD
jgi:protein-L-isoaspartate(D-aspartate) O-methyltransferase